MPSAYRAANREKFICPEADENGLRAVRTQNRRRFGRRAKLPAPSFPACRRRRSILRPLQEIVAQMGIGAIAGETAATFGLFAKEE